MNRMGAIVILLIGAVTAGCAADETNAAATGRAAIARTQPVHVDSIFPIEEELRRFREGLAEPPALGAGAAPSRDLLVRSFLDALAVHDSAAFAAMTLDRAEFAYLYYPHTKYTRPPYELSPALLWFQIQQNSEKGLARVLRRLGGTHQERLDYRCKEMPELHGPNRIWTGCELRIVTTGNRDLVPLFGAILERDGRFKFISYTNGL